MKNSKKRTGLFIMPRSSKDWIGAEALWITVAGWAAATERRLGNAYVLTSDAIVRPNEAVNYPITTSINKIDNTKRLYRNLPGFLKTFLKDILLLKRSKHKANFSYAIPCEYSDVAFVWEQHDLFAGPGVAMAKKMGVPFIIYVHAPVVWEMSKWGVNRYYFGKLLEKYFEIRSLKKADVVACVSNEVGDKLISMGINKEKILISPMAVDPYLFQNGPNAQLKIDLKLENKIILGWTGSFRGFHGLDLLVNAFDIINKTSPNTVLLLVGDGSERVAIEELVRNLGLTGKVIFAGRQPFSRIPMYVSIFDIAIVSARTSTGFHYSPLKLREYLAAGKPVLAPRAGEIPQMFNDNLHLKLYEAGNIFAMATAVNDIIDNPILAQKLAVEGKKHALIESTWDRELDRLIVKHLGNVY